MEKKRRFHRVRHARWLPSKRCWAATVGRGLTKGGRLADRDWYFPGHLSQEEADRRATEKAGRWEALCKSWPRTEQPLLEAFGQPFPAEPRWSPSLGSSPPTATLDPATARRLQDEHDVPEDVVIEALADYTMRGFIAFYGGQGGRPAGRGAPGHLPREARQPDGAGRRLLPRRRPRPAAGRRALPRRQAEDA